MTLESLPVKGSASGRRATRSERLQVQAHTNNSVDQTMVNFTSYQHQEHPPHERDSLIGQQNGQDLAGNHETRKRWWIIFGTAIMLGALCFLSLSHRDSVRFLQ